MSTTELIIIICMAGKLRPVNAEYLEAIAKGLRSHKEKVRSAGRAISDLELASHLGINPTTLSKYLNKRNPMSGDVLARACVDLGMQFEYKGLVICAASFPESVVVDVAPPPARQLALAFAADYRGPGTSWEIKQDRAEPMEFSLTIKVAS